MAEGRLNLVALGDIILGEDSEYYVNSIRPMLERFDARDIRFFGTSSGGGQAMSMCVYISVVPMLS